MTALQNRNWREHILGAFTPEAARLTLVADPDGLLLEEGVLVAVRERGFDLIPFDDAVAFRYAYESKYRAKWDRGEHTDLVVALRAPSAELSRLPWDLLTAGRRLSFSLADIFPNLSYPVVDQLSRGDLDALYAAQFDYPPGALGDVATKNYVLRHVFKIAPEQIRNPVDLLHALLRRHHQGLLVPTSLDEHLIGVLRRNPLFNGWPLDQIAPDRGAFLGFLQERWGVFLHGKTPQEPPGTSEPAVAFGLKFGGPAHLPFDHPDIRVYVDSLFLEGYLSAVEHPRARMWAGTWARVGLRLDPEADRLRKLDGLLDRVSSTVPEPEARHGEWATFALRWAELQALRYAEGQDPGAHFDARLAEVQKRVDDAFGAWMTKRYSGLYNQPATPPVMLHHLPRYLARRLAAEGVRKVAVVVLDGLALDQWATLRQELKKTHPGLSLDEQAIFAWVPTLTAVSRQAVFAGKPPLFFSGSITTTDREPALWNQFWLDQQLPASAVGYRKGLREGSLAPLEELVGDHLKRVLGLVVDMVDRIMHGAQLGCAGMHTQIRLWGRSGYLGDLLTLLVASGYEVHLTSDHGNIEAVGMGRPSEGALAEERGERVRVYANPILRSATKARFPTAIEWPTLGLPEGYHPLLAPNRAAFVSTQERVVAHGSIALDEVIVPWVRVEMAQR